MMTGREKLSQALSHRCGSIPVDCGSTAITGIHISVVEKLREYYGLEKKPVRVADPFQMLGVVDDDLKEALGVDVMGIFNPNTMFGFKDTGAKEWKTPWGQTVIVQDGFEVTQDSKGDTYIYAQGDKSFPPAGRLPAGGYFFDAIVRGHNFDEDAPHIEDNLEEFSEISDGDLQIMQKDLEIASKKDYGVIASIGGMAIGDIALVPATMLKQPKGLRDISEWYMATIANQDYLHQIFETQTAIALKNLEKIKGIDKGVIQAVVVCGTDFGTQNAPFCSNALFRELYMPYYKILNQWIHENTTWKTFKHSCGSIEPLIPELIESGFDILNPVQWSAENMEAQHLKDTYGDRLVFWGGGINTQQTLPFGTPDQVREEVLRCCEIFGKNGGFVFNSIHNIQARTPVENVIALFDAVREYNR